MTDGTGKTSIPEFFNKDMAKSYDQKNSKLHAIADNLHFLVLLLLEDLPPHARVLCVGAGTGAEILALAKARTDWSFVGVDPSAEMLGVCRDRLEEANVFDRCELIHGYVNDVQSGAEFDAVLSMLVAHFIKREDRVDFYRNVFERLKPSGTFVSAEISYDLDSAEFPAMLKNWERVQTLMGATADTLRTLPDTMRNTLGVLSPTETETLLKASGFDLPVQFFSGLHDSRLARDQVKIDQRHIPVPDDQPLLIRAGSRSPSEHRNRRG